MNAPYPTAGISPEAGGGEPRSTERQKGPRPRWLWALSYALVARGGAIGVLARVRFGSLMLAVAQWFVPLVLQGLWQATAFGLAEAARRVSASDPRLLQRSLDSRAPQLQYVLPLWNSRRNQSLRGPL